MVGGRMVDRIKVTFMQNPEQSYGQGRQLINAMAMTMVFKVLNRE